MVWRLSALTGFITTNFSPNATRSISLNKHTFSCFVIVILCYQHTPTRLLPSWPHVYTVLNFLYTHLLYYNLIRSHHSNQAVSQLPPPPPPQVWIVPQKNAGTFTNTVTAALLFLPSKTGPGIIFTLVFSNQRYDSADITLVNPPFCREANSTCGLHDFRLTWTDLVRISGLKTKRGDLERGGGVVSYLGHHQIR